MYRNHSRRRVGITLIEILVVLAIIAILVSLSAAALQRVRVARMVSTAEDVVGKIQTGLDNQVKIIADNARLEQRNNSTDYANMLTICNGDQDRAVALLGYCRMRQNFPHSQAELSSSSFTISGSGVSVTFNRPQAFSSIATLTGTDEEVSAAVLYIALSQRTQGGNSFASDDATSGAQGDITTSTNMTAKVYRDGWGKPIAFRRFFSAQDVPGDRSKDPFDPVGKLKSWSPPVPAAPALSVKADAEGKVGATFDATNRTFVVYSWGKNQKSDLSVTTPIGGDDILGYRLRSIGTKGAKP